MQAIRSLFRTVVRSRAATVLATSTAALGMTLVGVMPAGATTPTFVTDTVDDTTFLAQTSASCGFPVFEHDGGTVTTKFSTAPDGSVKSQVIVVKITYTFFSTDAAHTGTVTARPSGPAIEIDHPDGSVTLRFIGQDGQITAPGSGIVFAASGNITVQTDANGNVTEVAHGNFSPDHSGICPLL